jgi:hypothetical protein
VPLFQRQIIQLRELIENERWISQFKPSFLFKNLWGLEEDWRNRMRRENDVCFRFLITLHYCGFL